MPNEKSLSNTPKKFGPHDHLLTHSGCSDGSGCAIVFLAYGGKLENIHYTLPSHDATEEKTCELLTDIRGRGTLYLADVSIGEQLADWISKQYDDPSCKVQICDHHKSAIPLNQYSWCEIDVKNTRCGSWVFRDWCLRNMGVNPASLALRDFIILIDDRDRYINARHESLELYDLFNVLGQAAFVQRFHRSPDVTLTQEEKFAVACERRKKESYLKTLGRRVHIKTFGENRVGFVVCDQRYTSEGGSSLYDEFNLDAVVLINSHAISLRAPKDSKLDMSKLAQKFDGGGHKGAAGFQLAALLGDSLLEMVEGIFEKKPSLITDQK